MPDTTALKSETVGTVRTTTNMTVLSLIVAVIAKFTKWHVRVEDLLPYVPLFVPVFAAFYRLSLYLAKKFPVIGVVLYGINAPPKYVAPPDPAMGIDKIIPPDKGWVRNDFLMTVLVVVAIIVGVILILHFVDFTVK